jgi:hypothetical protein|tara:strand:- start:325 stop:654 length:330 start_codon:yes stop_codon:yes gene_type:complete
MASEVLKVAFKSTLTNSEYDLVTAASGKTITVLSITFCETAGNAETFDLYIRDDAGANDYEILSDQALGANETFEYTGRIVLEATDALAAQTASGADVDVVVTYLEQTL